MESGIYKNLLSPGSQFYSKIRVKFNKPVSKLILLNASMNITEIQNSIMTNLYLHYFDLGGQCNLFELRSTFVIEDVKYDNLLDRMVKEDLIVPRTAGGNYKITPYGVRWSEEQDFLPTEEVTQNQQIRTAVLKSLAELYEAQGPHQRLHIDQLNLEIKCEINRLAWNLHVLEYFDVIASGDSGFFKITGSGLEAVERYREDAALTDELEIISSFEPHKRGREFQSFFAKLVLRDGWEKEEGVRTISEEMDVMIHKGREFYLIECKWEKRPVQANVIRELYGKLLSGKHYLTRKGVTVRWSPFLRLSIALPDL